MSHVKGINIRDFDSIRPERVGSISEEINRPIRIKKPLETSQQGMSR